MLFRLDFSWHLAVSDTKNFLFYMNIYIAEAGIGNELN